MKDPLRYYVAEGFVIIHAFLDDTVGKMRGNYNAAPKISLKTLRIHEDSYLVVDAVAYPVDDDFFEKYATICDSEKEAISRGEAWANSYNTTIRFFSEFKKEISLVA